jgi:hypothetical protein
MAELVDAPDLGSGGIPCPSSSLGACTIICAGANYKNNYVVYSQAIDGEIEGFVAIAITTSV